MEKHLLSKSTFIRGSQCLKSLYLHKKRPFLRDPLSAEQRAKFSRGHDVGFLARQLFPGGIDMKPKAPSQYQKAVEKTSEYIISEKNGIIYEATFQFNRVLIMLDVLEIKDGKLYAYEVKSSKAISQTYLLDAALQYYVMSNAGFKPLDFEIIYIDQNYVRKGELALDKLFIFKPVLEEILGKQHYVSSQIEKEKETLLLKHSPKIDIGEHCIHPYPCDFTGHCWKHLPDISVFDLHFLSFEERMQLYTAGKANLADLSKEDLKTAESIEKLKSILEQSFYLDCAHIKKKIAKINPDRGFLHILLRRPAIPEFENTQPYQAIPFGIAYAFESDGEKKAVAELFEAQDDPFVSLTDHLKLLNDLKKDFIIFKQPGINEIIAHILKTQQPGKDISAFRYYDISDFIRDFHFFRPGLKTDTGLEKIARFILKDKISAKITSEIEAASLLNKLSVANRAIIAEYQQENLRILENFFDFLRKKCNIV
ncbi:MAG: hypothetical protein K9G58_07845 [Bacteroidales bacterium]|nr:hypothetical protein [Bacteroidales bacterium]MCF8398062.1 hypothetical protein [Bacteroidales bacterium]